MTTALQKPVKLMSKSEADDACKKVNLSMSSAGAILLDYHNREGFRAQGYTSFKEACSKEFEEHYGGRSTVYRLLRQEIVSENLQLPAEADRPPISVTDELGKLEEPKHQREAYEKAGGEEATATSAAAAVKEVKKKVKPKKADANKLEARYQEALKRISDVCGKSIRRDVENGILDQVTQKEAIYWADLADEAMADIQELVVGKRWLPSTAWKAVNKMITASSRIEEMLNQAVAHEGHLELDVDGYHIVVTQNRKKR